MRSLLQLLPAAAAGLLIAFSAVLSAESASTPAPDHKQYTETIPGSSVLFDMLPIPAGRFLMGSPANETGRKEDEGPQHPVEIRPFWMGKYEVTGMNTIFIGKRVPGARTTRSLKSRPTPMR